MGQVQRYGLQGIWSKRSNNPPLTTRTLKFQNSFRNFKHRYRRYVTLKIFIKSASMGQQLDDELNIYERIELCSHKHRGHQYVRSLHDTFDISGPDDKHRCLVHPPLWESMLAFLFKNPIQRLPTPMLAITLERLFLALDYLHTECKIIHTGIHLLISPSVPISYL